MPHVRSADVDRLAEPRLQPLTCRSATSSSVAALRPPGRFSAMYWISMPNWVPQSPCHREQGRASTSVAAARLGQRAHTAKAAHATPHSAGGPWPRRQHGAALQVQSCSPQTANGELCNPHGICPLPYAPPPPLPPNPRTQPSTLTAPSQCGSGAARRRRRTPARGQWCRR